MSYLTQLQKEAEQGLRDLCRGALADGAITEAQIDIAVASQLEIKDRLDFQRTPGPVQQLISQLTTSSDRDLSHVAAKILKSVRQAAFTYQIGEDAVYVDQEIDFDV